MDVSMRFILCFMLLLQLTGKTIGTKSQYSTPDDLSDSNMTAMEIYEAIKSLPSSTYIDVSKNHVNSCFDIDVIRKHKALRTVVLEYCNIGAIFSSARDSTVNEVTQTISLSGNNIEILDFNVFRGFLKLERIYLNSNKILKLYGFEQIKKILPSIERIALERNDFNCGELALVIEALEKAGVRVYNNKETECLEKSINGVCCRQSKENALIKLYACNVVNSAASARKTAMMKLASCLIIIVFFWIARILHTSLTQ